MTRTVHCDAPDCQSSCQLAGKDLSDEKVGPMLTERGWQALWTPGDSGIGKAYCQAHHDASLPNTKPGKANDDE